MNQETRHIIEQNHTYDKHMHTFIQQNNPIMFSIITKPEKVREHYWI